MVKDAFLRRVNQEIKEIVGEIISSELKDPRVGMATVVSVDLATDLGHAKIYVSVIGDADEQARTMEGIRSATGYIRTELSDRTRLKFVPELVFYLDTSAEYAAHIESLLKQIRKERGDEPS